MNGPEESTWAGICLSNTSSGANLVQQGPPECTPSLSRGVSKGWIAIDQVKLILWGQKSIGNKPIHLCCSIWITCDIPHQWPNTWKNFGWRVHSPKSRHGRQRNSICQFFFLHLECRWWTWPEHAQVRVMSASLRAAQYLVLPWFIYANLQLDFHLVPSL